MKTTKAYYHQGKFKHLPGDKWPDPDDKLFTEFLNGKQCYKEALTSAVKEAVDYEDQDAIHELVYKSSHYKNIVKLDEFHKQALPEGLYTIPEQEVEIKNVCTNKHYISGCTNETCWDLEECQAKIRVARIVSHELRKEESQELLWSELINVYDVADKSSYGYATLIKALSEKFTITRKQ